MTRDASAGRYLAVWLPLMAHECWRWAERSRTERSDTDRSPRHRCAPAPLAVSDAEDVVVFTEHQGNAVRLTALSRTAQALGLRPGITLADARACVPKLVAIGRDHAAEARLLGRIMAALGRYTPAVAAEPPDSLILDIAGCCHPYGCQDSLADDLVARLAACGLTTHIGFGATPEAARARSRFGGCYSNLYNLPVSALEAAPDVTLALCRAGLKTIGDLAARPSSMLSARFGDLALRLHRLLGHEDRRITPARTPPPVFALRRFAEPIGRVEDALACLDQLMREAAVMLDERHQGGRRFEARFFRSDGAVPLVTIETGRPTRDPAMLIRLVRDRIDALADPIDPGFGFDLIRLDVTRTEPLAPEQAALDGVDRPHEALDALIDRLAVRLGARRIHRVAPHDSHIPECASMVVAPTHLGTWPGALPGEPPTRPLQLIEPPQPVTVLYELPEGPPRRFAWRGRTHDVARWEGPERIAAEWWRRRDRGGLTRDYYRVEDEGGHRFWLFRHGLQGSERPAPDWYLHGLFA